MPRNLISELPTLSDLREDVLIYGESSYQQQLCKMWPQAQCLQSGVAPAWHLATSEHYSPDMAPGNQKPQFNHILIGDC